MNVEKTGKSCGIFSDAGFPYSLVHVIVHVLFISGLLILMIKDKKG